MRVKHAVQVLSGTMASVIETFTRSKCEYFYNKNKHKDYKEDKKYFTYPRKTENSKYVNLTSYWPNHDKNHDVNLTNMTMSNWYYFYFFVLLTYVIWTHTIHLIQKTLHGIYLHDIVHNRHPYDVPYTRYIVWLSLCCKGKNAW